MSIGTMISISTSVNIRIHIDTKMKNSRSGRSSSI